MSKRDQALAIIRSEVAKHGYTTRLCMRTYLESRTIGCESFTRACSEGFKAYKSKLNGI
jgi:hypothetical protein